MEQHSFIISTAQAFASCLAEMQDILERQSFQTVLAAVIVPLETTPNAAHAITSKIKDAFPEALVYGHSAYLSSRGSQVEVSVTRLTFRLFTDSDVTIVPFNWAKTSMMSGAETLAKATDAVRDAIAALELMTAGDEAHLGPFFAPLTNLPEHVPVFGGMVDSPRVNFHGCVFTDEMYAAYGAIAVIYSGKDLHAKALHNFGWRRLGKKMTITKLDGDFIVEQLDGLPITSVYEKYFGLKNDENFSLNAVLFPICLERQGEVIARNPYYNTGEAGVIMGTPMVLGESVRFAYPDPTLMRAGAIANDVEMAAFGPECILAFNCLGHYFVLEDDIVCELQCSHKIPSASVSTYVFGEILRFESLVTIASLNTIAVGMREGSLTQHLDPPRDYPQLTGGRARFSSLAHFAATADMELREVNEQLSHIAGRDHLTDLLNRRAMELSFSDAIKHARKRGLPLSVLMMDIDNFKDINDTCGHDVGDIALKHVAQTIMRNIRHNDIGCRWGGDEFFVLLCDTSLDIAQHVAERIRNAIGKVTVTKPFTTSIGLTSYVQGDTVGTLFSRADHALYEAKRRGKNNVRVVRGTPLEFLVSDREDNDNDTESNK